MSQRHTLSVVVPALDEAEHLPRLLGDLEPLDAELVVVDGGSLDETVELARSAGAGVVHEAPGRGRQLRAGAAASSGAWLFFVHADSRLSAPALRALRGFLERASEHDFAHFAFELEGHDWIHRFIEFGQRLRERWLGLVYGDQGLVVSRALYDRVSGYPDWPLMEDVEMVRRLEAVGRRVALSEPLVTSARRYDEEGGLRRWMRNVALMGLFRLGVDPARLTRWYRPRRSRPVGARTTASGPPAASRTGTDVVGVFVKAPTPGRVKTRLAADVGDERATEIYRTIGRATVDALRGGPYRLIVYVDPPDDAAFQSVRDWLGDDGIELRPQAPGDLGGRMSAALSAALEETGRALLVGSDIPGIDEATVRDALRRLDESDVVLGPASDGGYYLVGLRRPCPALFRDVPWSTGRVLATTLERADEAGLGVTLLEEKSDVDTVADLLRASSPTTGAEA